MRLIVLTNGIRQRGFRPRDDPWGGRRGRPGLVRRSPIRGTARSSSPTTTC